MINRLRIASLIIGVFTCATVIAEDSMALSDGYVLCGAYSGKFTVLIDQHGAAVHTWQHNNLPDSLNGYVVYLLESGNILRTSQVNQKTDTFPTGAGPIQGIVEEIDPNGALVWKYKLSNDTPSGNQWVHLNGITICEKRNLIAFTSRLFSELFIIDHGTTTRDSGDVPLPCRGTNDCAFPFFNIFG